MSMDLIPLVLLGGVLALDATSVGQFMVSRPLVAGALAGWACGAPAMGLAMGAMLELYLLVAFPTGGSRFPEGATATVVAVASACTADASGAVPLGIALGLVWGRLGGLSITGLRKLNGRLVPEPEDARVSPRRVVAAHLGAVFLDFLRACAVTLTGILVGRAVLARTASEWPISAPDSRGLLLVGAAVSSGILLRSLGGFRRRRVLFAAGLAVGIIGARFL
jgi:PTS system mannose-specific IIC component